MIKKHISFKEKAIVQSSTLKSVRKILDGTGAMEVRTPVLNPMPDLAPMPQFIVQNPKNGRLNCLRIAPEEALTRALALGVPALYEISNNFRIEEHEDDTHLIEFDSVEALFCEQPIETTFEVVENICREIAVSVSERLGLAQTWLDEQPTIPRINLCNWLENEFDVPHDELLTREGIFRIAQLLEQPITSEISLPESVDHIIECVASKFNGAIFIGCFPHFLGGAAARHPEYPEFVERYELFYNGVELGSVANQLTDIDDWQSRYKNNVTLKSSIGIEPNEVNHNLLDDLAKLKKPFTGFGLGIDRVAMLAAFCNSINMVKFNW